MRPTYDFLVVSPIDVFNFSRKRGWGAVLPATFRDSARANGRVHDWVRLYAAASWLTDYWKNEKWMADRFIPGCPAKAYRTSEQAYLDFCKHYDVASETAPGIIDGIEAQIVEYCLARNEDVGEPEPPQPKPPAPTPPAPKPPSKPVSEQLKELLGKLKGMASSLWYVWILVAWMLPIPAPIKEAIGQVLRMIKDASF